MSAGVTGAGSNEFKVLIKGSMRKDPMDPNSFTVETSFNFDRSSSKYIRKVFNTNPTLINSDITRTAQTASYWLGPTYEREVSKLTGSANFGIILGLDSGSNSAAANFRFGFQSSTNSLDYFSRPSIWLFWF